MLILIDNYDSFSYNLYQMLGTLDPSILVLRNDAVSVEELAALQPDGLILSPGPGRPEDAGICMEAVRAFAGKIPILGVCLGHQAICAAYGAVVSYARHLMHGKASPTLLDTDCPLFHGCPGETPVARYHSLAVRENTLPEDLIITARADDGEIMAVSHRKHPVYGLQFHPESILTPRGATMLGNFLSMTGHNH